MLANKLVFRFKLYFNTTGWLQLSREEQQNSKRVTVVSKELQVKKKKLLEKLQSKKQRHIFTTNFLALFFKQDRLDYVDNRTAN